ncbi:protein IQ-DOMAIN 14 isoform X2 [Brachypodium distachyon]|uniref:Uncharacterized protein n=1 Tax=Brachypodium distachyon TaxID=15368 RepID=A0A0Q3GH55_BRADI|nr:protein IQ-DOMAIN 14 isoform X2 [Brachypodium distachyon]KQK09677.1 hypothetical protein BRADI_2g49490v3 [Brachypodium distachyon]|eukprot:XP_010232302.1 protein IQ-DOMAIN 14 isoform X2 [Brachypodium distachyon]
MRACLRPKFSAQPPPFLFWAGFTESVRPAMGRAMRWLKKVLTGRKEGHRGLKEIHAATDLRGAAEKETTGRWSFVKQRKSGVDGGKRSSDQAPVAVAEPSQGRLCRCAGGVEVRAREEMAALVIQKAFRGYLARKALRALRSLVKLQALVRGYLVRKQATTTLHRLQALMRLQADTYAVKRDSYRKSTEQERIVAQDARTKPSHRRRLSDSTDSNYEQRGSPRIVEMDTCQLRSRSTRITTSGRHAHNTTPDRSSFSPQSVIKQPPRLSTRHHERERDYPARHAKTAQNTPRFLFGHGPPAYEYDSPAKSVDGGGGLTTPSRLLISHRDLLVSPRYMAGTASSAARMRCQSAPRQRQLQGQGGEGPRASLTQLAGSRKSACTHMQAGGFCLHCSEAATHTGCSDVSDEAARDYYLDRMW